MDTKQISIFLSVAQSLNFTKAAQEHYMTQPAISHRISELEEELGAKLFIRTSHHVSLTTAGQEFLPHAQELLAKSRLAASRVYDVSHGKTGHLRVLSVHDCLGTTERCLTAFARQYPNIKIEADVVTGADQINAINHDDADIYFTFSELLSSYGHMQHRILQKKPYSLLMPAGSDPDIDTKDLSCLANTPFICERDSQAPYLVSEIMRICRNRGLEPTNIHWVNSAISQLLSIKCGLGFTIIPGSHVSFFTEDLCIIPIHAEDAVASEAIGWKRNTGNQAVSYFLQVVQRLYPETAMEA